MVKVDCGKISYCYETFTNKSNFCINYSIKI